MSVERIGRDIGEVVGTTMLQMQRGMERGVKAIEAESKVLVGVDTGNLRASLTSETLISASSIVGMVGSDVEYAFFHSLQNPYLENAVDANLQFLIKAIGEEVGR